MTDPIVIDFFCCGGGASEGYARAGLDVYGVDLARVPGYGYDFRQDDAIATMRHLLDGKRVAFNGGAQSLSLDEVSAFVGSPPCQVHSALAHLAGAHHVDLIPPTRELFRASGKPYIIENVVGAPLIDPTMLCGSMFGLGAHTAWGFMELRRHRLFESNIELTAPACRHGWSGSRAVIGVYGNGSGWATNGSSYKGTKSERSECLGIDWLTSSAMSQAIPPAYTEHLGRQLRAHIIGETA